MINALGTILGFVALAGVLFFVAFAIYITIQQRITQRRLRRYKEAALKAMKERRYRKP